MNDYEFNNALSKSIDVAEKKACYDEHVKRLFASREVLAEILLGTVKELKGFSKEQVMYGGIIGEPQISSAPLGRDIFISEDEMQCGAQCNSQHLHRSPAPTVDEKTNVGDGQCPSQKLKQNRPDFVESGNTEDKTVSEGTVYFDLKFNIYIPQKDETIGLIINIEAQKDDNKSYPLEKRAVYYASRLISAQKDVVFKKQDYRKIRKVYSIWIQKNVSDKKKNTLSVYNLKENVIIGSYKAKEQYYDLINIVMIRLGSHKEKTQNKLIDMLNILLSSEMKTDEKKRCLSEDFDMSMTEKTEGRINDMCNLSEGIYEQGIEQGVSQGVDRSIIAVNMLMSGETDIDKIAEEAQMSKEDVERLAENLKNPECR